MTNIISIIPARGGSKGIPGKNLKLLAGKPLIAYSIEVSLKSKNIDRTFISTDDEEIAKAAKELDAEVIVRPDELATDTASVEPALIHAIDFLKKEGYDADVIVFLQNTAPLRSVSDVDGAVDMLLDKKADTVVSVYEDYYYSWFGEVDSEGQFVPKYDWQNRNNRQAMKPKLHEIGSIYVMTAEHLRKNKNRMGGRMFPYIIDKKKALDIDDEYDFWLIEEMIKNKKVKL